MPIFRSAPPAKVVLMTIVNPDAHHFCCACSVRRFIWFGCDGQDAEATATADQALIRASKAHTGIRREIPVSVAREYGKRRSLTTLGDFSDLLRHPGHRIVCVQVSFPFSSGASSLPLQGCAAAASL